MSDEEDLKVLRDLKADADSLGEELDPESLAELQELERKEQAKNSHHWACAGCDICGSAGHGNSWF